VSKEFPHADWLLLLKQFLTADLQAISHGGRTCARITAVSMMNWPFSVIWSRPWTPRRLAGGEESPVCS
jgi:hypothetical protein